MKRFLFLLVVFLSAIQLFAQKDGKNENKFNVSGNFQSDLQYYFEDQKIGAVAVDEKLLSNSYANFMISYGKFSAGVRFEGYYNTLLGFPNSGGKNDGSGIPSYWANFTNDKLEVTVGHFYEQFGNGLTLRSYEEKSLGIDNAILGARVKYTIVPGVNIKGLVGKQRYYWELSDGILRGVDGEIQFNEMIKSLNESQFRFGIGGSFVSKYQKEDNPIYNLPNNVATGAGRINIGYSDFNLISEYAYKINDPSADNNYIYRPGQAFLINATYSQKGLGVILSTKWVDNMSLRSDRNATLSDLTVSYLPEITRNYTYVLQAFYPYASQPMGEWGVKGEFFYKFKKGTKLGGKYGTTITLNYSRVHNIKKTAINDSTPIGTTGTYGYNTSLFAIGKELYYQDINVEISKKWSKKWYTNIAYMNLYYNYNVLMGTAGHDNVKANIGVIEATYKITDKYALKAEVQAMFTKQDKGNWILGQLEFTMPNWFFTVFDNWNYGNPDKSARVHYFNVGFGYVKGGNRIQLTYGKQREGVMCVGGVCRHVPASNGFALSISSTF